MTWLAPARALTVATLAAATLSVVPTGAAARPAPALATGDLPSLQAELARVTAHAEALADQLSEAAARDGGLRVAFARLEDARYDAQQALDRRAREVYIASATSPVGDWQASLASPTLRIIAHRGQRAALSVDQYLIDAVTSRASQVAVLQRQADAFRRQLLVQAQGVLADQERARLLLARALAAAEAAHAVEVQRALEAQRAALDVVSADVTLALTPAQTRRSQKAKEEQAPVIALLEATGSGMPAGYRPTGQVISGQASWYGPGFVGKPTASGAPYDPERLTCAHKTLPLGTVVHVTSGGLAVNCLVNDRGPYVGERILDMSRAGSRALGYSGVADVTVEVLAPG